VALAFPDTPTFRTYLRQIEVARQAVGFRVFMVKPDRTVEVMPASGSQAATPSHRNSEIREIAMKRNQRDVTREVYRQQAGNEERVVRAYAAAEQRAKSGVTVTPTTSMRWRMHGRSYGTVCERVG